MNEKAKFKIGEVVLYKRGDMYDLGIIKSVVSVVEKVHLKQQGFPPIGEPEGSSIVTYKYFVWYHTGDTASLTDEDLLHKIENLYAFSISRNIAD